MREEVDRVLGNRTEITFQDIAELKYCAGVFKEALRLWPPVPFFTRFCDQEWEIEGLRIPKNTPLHMSSYANARLEKYFKDAYEFKPERFIKDKESESKYILFLALKQQNFLFILMVYLCFFQY